MVRSLRFEVASLALIVASCSGAATRNNPYDPQGTGPKASGRIAGTVFVQGATSQGGITVHIEDALGAEADAPLTGAEGDFVSAELEPGSFVVTVDVPAGNSPVIRADVEVLPGATTNLGTLLSTTAPPDGWITGTVALEQTSESAADVRVVLTRTDTTVSESWVAYSTPAGTYGFAELRPGTYELRADKSGFTPDRTAVVVESSARALAQPATLHLYPASAVVRFSVGGASGAVLGAPYTATRTVSLVLLAFGGVNQMRLSESPALTENGVEVAWRDHVAEVPLTLSAGEGTKSIYAQFRVLDAGNVERLRTETYRTSIVYDVTPPAVASMVLAPDATVTPSGRYLTGDPAAVPVQITATDLLSRVKGYRLLVEGQSPTAVPYRDVTATDATVLIAEAVSLSSADGPKIVAVQLVDAAGNESTPVSRTVTLDRTAPAGSVSIKAGAARTSLLEVPVTLTASDAGSGVVEYKLSSGDTCSGGAWQPFVDPDHDGVVTATFALEGGDGVDRSVSALFRDGAGLVSSCVSDFITVDDVGPDSARVTIRRGSAAVADGYTSDPQVTLDLFALGAATFQVSTDVTDLYFGNVALAPNAMAAAAVSTDLCLEGGVPPACTALPPGTNTTVPVYVRFYDDLGNGSAVAQASIIVDDVAPTGAVLTVPQGGDTQVVGGHTFSRSPVLTVAIQVPIEPGLQMRLCTDGAFDSESWVEYATTATVVLPAGDCAATDCKSVQAQFRDRAGNVSAVASVALTLDSTPPTAPHVTGGSSPVRSTAYTLQIVAPVSDTFFAQYEVSGGQYATFADSRAALASQPIGTTSFAFTLQPNQVNILRVRAVDLAGNVSQDDFAVVEHDDRAPDPPHGVRADPFDGELDVRWIPSSSTDISYYKVYYGSLSGLYTGTYASEGNSPVSVGNNLSVNLTGLTNGNRQYVAVTAVDRAGNESGYAREVTAIPSLVAPRFLSQVGGPITGVWLDSGRVYLGVDGGLRVFNATDGAEVAFLPNLPDVSQVQFAGGRVYVHGADPQGGPVPVKENTAGYPSADAPERVVSVFGVSGNTHTLVRRVSLPTGTMTFLVVSDGVTTRAVTATSGATSASQGNIAFALSTVTFWDLDGQGVPVPGATLTSTSVTGWSVIRGRYVVLTGYPAGEYSESGFFFFVQPELSVLDAFGGAGAEVSRTVVNPANDGYVWPFGELYPADALLTTMLGEQTSVPVVDLSTPAAPVVHGTNPYLGLTYDATATGGSTTTVVIGPGSVGNLGYLPTPMLVGHTLTCKSGTAANLTQVRTITAYTFDAVAGITYTLGAPLPAAVSAGDVLTLQVDATPTTGNVSFAETSVSSVGDPASRRVFTLAKSDRRTVSEYTIAVTPTPESATKAAFRTFDFPVKMLRVAAGYLVVVTAFDVELYALGTWSSAPPSARLPVDYDLYQLDVQDGFLYAAARRAPRFTVVDVGDPESPRTVGRIDTNTAAGMGVLKLAASGNRLYALEGVCSDTACSWGANQHCGCTTAPALRTYTLTTRDKRTTTVIAGATPGNPVLTGAAVTLSAPYVDDLVPWHDQLLFWSHGDGTGAAVASILRTAGQTNGVAPGTPVGAQAVSPPPDSETFGMAVSGKYVFVTSYRGLRAYKLTAAGTSVGVGKSADCCLDDVRDLQVQGNYLFAFGGFYGLNIYDVSKVLDGTSDGWAGTVENITKAGAWDAAGGPGGVVAGPYAYVMTSSDLRIVDVTTPALPKEVYTIDVAPVDVKVSGGLLYVATKTGGIRIYELTRPSAFRYGQHAQNGAVHTEQMTIGGGWLFSGGAGATHELFAWRLGSAQTKGDLPTLFTANLSLPAGDGSVLQAFGDDELWAGDQGCAGATTCLRVYDTSYLAQYLSEGSAIAPLLNARALGFNDQISSTVPINSDASRVCSTDADCCGWQRCGTWTGVPPYHCQTDSQATLRKIVRGAGTEYFVLARGRDGGKSSVGQPNDGIYSITWDNPFGAPVRRTSTSLSGTTTSSTRGLLSGYNSATCAYANPEAQSYADILWNDGVLYVGGSWLMAVHAVRWDNTEDFLGLGTAPEVTKTRGPTGDMCSKGLAVSGHYLFVAGNHGATSSNCTVDMTRTGANLELVSNRLFVYDISSPMTPTFISELALPESIDAMAVSGNWVFLSNENSKHVLIVDASDHADPFIAGAFTTVGINAQLQVYGTDLFVNGEFTGINALDGR